MQQRNTRIEELVIDETAKKEKERIINSYPIDHLTTIKNTMKELNLAQSLIENYNDFVNQMESLDECIKSYGGNKLSLEDRDKVLESYQKVADAILKLRLENKKIGSKDADELLGHVNKLSTYLSDDIRALIKMNKPQTIVEISQNARKRVIDITNKETQNIGANLSDRQIIQDGNEKKVFTKHEILSNEQIIENNIKNYTNKYPDYANLFNKFTKKECYKKSQDITRIKSENSDYAISASEFSSIANTYQLDSKDIKEIKKVLKNDNIAQIVMHDFLDSVYKVSLPFSYQGVIKTGKDEPLAERNSAMSVVAELFGMGNVICHSEPVTIKNDKEVVEGTLMNFSTGSDPNNMKNDDKLSSYAPKDIKITPEAKKQIADIQVLDFICGNLDRHAGNMFLKYDLNDPKNPKLVGIEGIDNDASFYTTTGFKEVKGVNKMVGLSCLTMIDKKTADKIKMITPAMLCMALQGMKLSIDAIKMTMHRFDLLQKAILYKTKNISYQKDEHFKSKDIEYSKGVEDFEDIKINIIQDETSWNKIDIFELNEERHNLFTQTGSILGGKANLAYLDVQIKDVYQTKLALSQERKESRKNINTRLNLLDQASKFFRSSSKYRKVQKALEKVQKIEKNIKFNDNHKAYVNYKKALNDLKSKAQQYLDKKETEKRNGAVFSDYTKNRIKQVDDIFRMIDNRINNYDNKIDELKAKEEYLQQRKTLSKNFKKIRDKRISDELNEALKQMPLQEEEVKNTKEINQRNPQQEEKRIQEELNKNTLLEEEKEMQEQLEKKLKDTQIVDKRKTSPDPHTKIKAEFTQDIENSNDRQTSL